MAPPFPPPPAPFARPPVVRSWAPALVALSLATAAGACGDDPEPESFLGAGGAPPPGSVYGAPYVPNLPPAGAGGQGGSGGEAGSPPSRVLPASAATACAGLAGGIDLPGVTALAAVGGLSAGPPLAASFGGKGYLLDPAAVCAAEGAGGAAGAGGTATPVNDLPSPTLGWAVLADGRRVAATSTQLLLLPAAGAFPLAVCPLPERPAGTRRRFALAPNDPLRVWVVDGGSEIIERHFVEGGTCEEPPSTSLTGVAVRDVAGDQNGRLWLAVLDSNGAEGSFAQVRGARVVNGQLSTAGEPSWPERSGPCIAGGLFAADAIAALPGGGVAVADGACGAVVRLTLTAQGALEPLGRVTLPAGIAPRAVAADGADGLVIASAIDQLTSARVGLWRAAPPTAPAGN